MRLYGGLMNRIGEHVKNPTPVVGMGLTVYLHSDRHAGTITKVSPSGKTIWFTEDTATRVDKNGMSESQLYTFTPNLDGPVRMARIRKNGTWRSGGDGISLGSRSYYYDFSF